MTIEATLERIADALETLVARAAMGDGPVALGLGLAKREAKPAKAKAKADAVAKDEEAPDPAVPVAGEPAPDAAPLPPFSIDALKAACMAYGQKAGTPLLKELLIEAGSETGAWSGVPVDGYQTLFVRVTDLLGAE